LTVRTALASALPLSASAKSPALSIGARDLEDSDCGRPSSVTRGLGDMASFLSVVSFFLFSLHRALTLPSVWRVECNRPYECSGARQPHSGPSGQVAAVRAPLASCAWSNTSASNLPCRAMASRIAPVHSRRGSPFSHPPSTGEPSVACRPIKPKFTLR